MALDVNDSAAGPGREEARGPAETLIYSQDVKCFLCGFISGQLVGPPRLAPAARSFNPAPGCQTPVNFHPARPRCFRCGGPCFLDEVETRILLREEELEKPRRGRKPKPRPI